MRLRPEDATALKAKLVAALHELGATEIAITLEATPMTEDTLLSEAGK